MTDLEKIYNAIVAKAPFYTNLEAYYSGNQPAVYLTQRLREIFKGVDIRFSENWCSVVVNACAERINLTGFDAKDARAKTVLGEAWTRNNLGIEASDIHTDALVDSECFAIAWPGEDKRAEVYYNCPSMVHVIYKAEAPRVIAFAGKMFDGDDGQARITLYYPDRLEYYIAKKGIKDVTNPKDFELDTNEYANGQAPNPYDRVPVFHFRVNRKGLSDLDSVVPLQNGINKLLSDMMVAAEYGAFSQRWVIANADTSQLKNAPGMIWEIPPGDGVGQSASVGQFSATELGNYYNTIDKLSMAIGVITRTPKHYFFTQSGDPSGEALIALEAPLNKKAQDRIDRFTPTWRELAAFICQIEGVKVDPTTITPLFEKPETIQPRTMAEITKIRVDSKVPLKTALTWEGKTEAEIVQMQKDADEESNKANIGLANALLEAERQSRAAGMGNQNGSNGNQPMNQNMNNQGVTNG